MLLRRFGDAAAAAYAAGVGRRAVRRTACAGAVLSRARRYASLHPLCPAAGKARRVCLRRGAAAIIGPAPRHARHCSPVSVADGSDPECGEFGSDAEIDVTELPHAFRTAIETIPNSVPYL